ncbi:MAG: FAD-binding protein [Lachnospiraceae bacterium]|nr:FAD-binding protein [Lachnospiraceae bacterium]
MKEKISRKTFIKGLAAGAASFAVLGAFEAAESMTGKSSAGTSSATDAALDLANSAAKSSGMTFTPGTYTATATGMGEITMTATFDESSITDIQLDLSNETPDIGQAAKDTLIEQCLAAQSSEIDGVSGATVTTNAVKKCLDDCIAQAGGTVAGTASSSAISEDELTYADFDDETRGQAMKEAAAEGRVFGYSGHGNWLGKAPEYADSEIDEEIDTDVVVVGLGHAGAQAVLGAAEKGCSVIGIEAQTKDMFAWYGEDIGAWNSEFAKAQGIPEWNLGEVVDEFVTRGGGRVDPGIVDLYVKNSGATLDHMLEVCKEMGVDSRVYTYDNTEDGWTIIHMNADYEKIAAGEDIYDCLDKTNYPRKPGTKTWPATVQFMGPYTSDTIDGVSVNSVLKYVEQAQLDKAVQDYGAEVYFGTAAQVLLQNEDGDVIGVIAKDSDGKIIKYNTSKGVVMCGGDYAANSDMCWALLNEYMERYEREGGVKSDFFSGMGGRDGSSVKMMCWAGGQIDPAPRGTMIIGGGVNNTPWGSNCMLWLNCEGKRFCNEGNITGANTAAARQKSGDAYLVTDKNFMKSVCASGIEHSGPNAGRPQYYQDLMDDMENIQPGSEPTQIRGCAIAERMGAEVYKCDTLEELADAMGVSADAKQTFLDSIEHYNELCDNGADTDFGKAATCMIPVREAPFYGCKQTIGRTATKPSMVTMSGIMTDLSLNVLDLEGNKINGLYAAGNSLGGRYGTGYSTPCAGNSIGMAVTHGRLAGQFCADQA